MFGAHLQVIKCIAPPSLPPQKKTLAFFIWTVFLLRFFSLLRGLLAGDYLNVFWTTFAEFPGTVLAMFLINRLGRKKTLAAQCLLFSAATVLVAGCGAGKGLLLPALFAARAFSSGIFQAVYVFTPEAFPTKLRAIAMGERGFFFARIVLVLFRIFWRSSNVKSMSILLFPAARTNNN